MLPAPSFNPAGPDAIWVQVQRRFLLLMVVAWVLLAVAAAAIDLAATRNDRRRALHLNAEIIAQGMEPAIRRALESTEQDALEATLRTQLRNRALLGLSVRLDSERRLHTGLMRGASQELVPLLATAVEALPQHLHAFTTTANEPARLVLYLDPTPAMDGVWRMLAVSLAQSLVLGGVLILMARRAMRRWFLPPLQRLSQSLAHLDAPPGEAALRTGAKADAPAEALLSSFNSLLTALEQKEAALKEELAHAKSLLGEQDEALAQAQKDAEAAINAKRRFLTRVSHELRTPLHAVIGMSQLAQATTLTPRQRSYLEVITASAESLLRLLNDLLDIARMETRNLALEHAPFDLRLMLDELADSFVDSLTRKPVQLIVDLDVEAPCSLVGDSMRLRQILANVLENSLQSTESGYILLLIRRDRETEQHVELFIEVKDTGCGVDPERIPHLFEVFTEPRTADADTAGKAGTDQASASIPEDKEQTTFGSGLGLVVSQRLVEIMGGRMWATSPAQNEPTAPPLSDCTPAEGRGTSVMCSLWLEKDAHASCTPPGAEALRHMRVLVVDANTHVRYVATQLLHTLGCLPQAAASMDAALHQLGNAKRPPFDCLLLEENLLPDGAARPGEAMGVLPRLMQEHDIPVVLLTVPSREASRQSTPQGVCALLEKPLRQRRLASMLLHCCNLPQQDLPATSPPQTAPLARSLQGMRVLVVEDNPINQDVTRRLLQQLGVAPVIAPSGEAAMVHYPERPEPDAPTIHAVLLDLLMPGWDGYETARRIRLRPTGKEVPILALTASAVEGVAEACQEAGMHGVLHKPTSLRSLQDALEPLAPEPHSSAPAALRADAHAPMPPEQPRKIEGIDMVEAVKRLGGNEALVLRILANAVPVLERDGASLQQAMAAKDPSAARHYAHRMAGAAGNISAVTLRTAALDVEAHFLTAPPMEEPTPHTSAPWDGDWDAATVDHEALQAILQQLLDDITTLEDA